MSAPTDVVREGYDRIAEDYLRVRRADDPDIRLVRDLADRLAPASRALDAGCGAGWPIAALLAERLTVTGIDLSRAQVRLATGNVPGSSFAVADLRRLPFGDDAFAATVSIYALIHVPREDHPAALAELRRVLAPGGLLLLTMGASDLEGGVYPGYLDTDVPMYWSHYGRERNLELVAEAGFELVNEELVREDEAFGGGAHLFVLARKGSA